MTHAITVERLLDPITHVDELIALRSRWAPEQGRATIDGDSFVEDFTAWVKREVEHREFWIARIGAEPVGMVNLLMFERMPAVGGPAGGWGYLCNMFVDDTHRNNGFGAELASAVVAFADEAGLERIVLKPSERSRPFYGALGFDHADDLLLVRQRP